ncbi:hypothetical protein [Endozoicomonas sp. ONNA1]|uniref:hypothetical protein n=1 Tax=Endozoicomonas sp. ONNA1 TaxID=2828740 RepID=UPI002147DE01|nr:hypothetical protein [Endozoicomonas sp. ONNA1]
MFQNSPLAIYGTFSLTTSDYRGFNRTGYAGYSGWENEAGRTHTRQKRLATRVSGQMAFTGRKIVASAVGSRQ